MPTFSLHDLYCENIRQPIGIHTRSPRLSWKLLAGHGNTIQEAYRIEVACSAGNLAEGKADLWDSGRVESEQSHLVPYEGIPLSSRMVAYWRVTVWDNHGNQATSAEPASWEMGLTEAADWQAAWIASARQVPVEDPLVHDWCEKVVYRPISDGGYERERKLDERANAERPDRIETVKAALPATWLRRRFLIKGPVGKARLYTACLGYAEVFLDGKKLNDRVLDPSQTDYEIRALYNIDILDERLPEGEHELRIHLAEGWYGQSHGFFDPTFRYGKPLVLAQLEILYTDGSTETIATGEEWEAAPSQLAKANIYSGEVCDGRVTEQDLEWGPVAGPDPDQPVPERLESQLLPPTRKVDTISPKSIIETRPGVYLVDMGINFAGWISLTIEETEGTVVDLRYTEIVTPEKELDWHSIGRRAVGVYQWDRYIAGGNGRETYEPRFTYHGFQYVEIEGLSRTPKAADITGYQVRTDFQRTGKFHCSDPFLNKLHACILWTYEANFVGLPADCPHREKCGWLDAYNTAEMVYHNWDIGTSIGKYIEDIRTSSELLGGLPGNVAPGRRNGMFEAFDWGLCTILLPWYRYQYTGDLRLVEEHWDYMVRYLEFGEEIAPHGIVSGALGDWCDQPASLELSFTRVDGSPFNSHPATTASMHYFFAVKSMAAMARELGKDDVLVATFEQRAEKIRLAIIDAYFHKRAMTFNSQTENAMALIYGVVDPKHRQAVADRLAEEIVHGNDGHFNVGAHGSGFLYHALSDFGHGDVALEMFNKEAYPSYRYMFSQGATSIWENMSRWDPVRKTTTKSLSHPFQSGFDHWFHNTIGGVQRDPACPGFKRLLFQPQLVGLLDSAEAAIQTPYGTASSAWKLGNGDFHWEISIPANCSATVIIPMKLINGSLDDEPIDLDADYRAIPLGSGTYQIRAQFPGETGPSSVCSRLDFS
ncbi:MAG: family 78 glycoside hydrolase catalytic domain [Puniceicoccaceae bacterium]